MNDVTIIYYTSNQEKEDFEGKVRQNILDNTDLPIVSVSQKPIDFGKNICVGMEVGVSGFNVCRQTLIACEEAKTPFVLITEADCLYPPDYFTFVPDKLDEAYRNTNLYVMGLRREYFYKKDHALHAQIVGREYYIDRLKYLFGDGPMWSTEEFNFPKERGKKLFDSFEFYRSENPVVQIKTSQGMRYHTSSERTPIYKIPFWGDGANFRKAYIS